MADKLPVKQSGRTQILGIGGSPRKSGNSDILLQHILHNIGEAEQLRDLQFQSCIGCEKCRKDKICTGLQDDMSLLYPKIVAAKGLVLVSPTHNYNVSALMKAFIDRLYCFYNFDTQDRPGPWSSQLEKQGRKAVIVAVCEQENKKDMGVTLEAMRWPLEALGYEVIEELPVFGVFARGKVQERTKILDNASEIGKHLLQDIS